jgi:hypothetical protein
MTSHPPFSRSRTVSNLLLAATALAGATSAQVNAFVFFPQDPERQTITCASFVGRPDVHRAAEGLVKFDHDWFRGIGNSIHFAFVFGAYHWVHDQRLSTVETYDVVLRTADAQGGPNMSLATGEILRVPGLTTPPSTNTGRGTWIMYDGFPAVPVNVPPDASWFFGISLPANPNWPATDGHSFWRADMVSAGTGATVGENNRAGAPHPTWAVPPIAPPFTTPWTYIMGPFVTTPVLHVGGIDPTSARLGAPGANLSMNGLFPDVGGAPRRDGLMVRVTDSLWPAAWTALTVSTHLESFAPGPGGTLGGQPGWWIDGLYNSCFLNGSTQLMVAFAQLNGGVREFPIAAAGTIPTAMVGTTIAFQALEFDPNGPQPPLGYFALWTNAQSVNF